MSDISPAAILYDENGNPLATQNGAAVVSTTPGVYAHGSDGTNARRLRTAADGTVRTDPTGTTTQPISGTVAVSGSVAVTGPLTDTQLRATAVPVSGPLTDAQLRATAVPVSAGSLPLPTGAATAALQTTGNSTLSSIDGKTAPFGQAVMASSSPVVIASNQSAIQVVGTAANGASPSGNPHVVAGVDAVTGLVDDFKTRSGAQYTLPDYLPTFVANFESIAFAANKNMAHIQNAVGSTVTVYVMRVWVNTPQTAAVTGVATALNLKRATSITAPTAATPVLFDTTQTLNASVTCGSAGTVVGEATPSLGRRWFTTDEWGPGTLDMEGMLAILNNNAPMFDFTRNPMKPVTLRAGEALFLKNITSTVGALDVQIEFCVI